MKMPLKTSRQTATRSRRITDRLNCITSDRDAPPLLPAVLSLLRRLADRARRSWGCGTSYRRTVTPSIDTGQALYLSPSVTPLHTLSGGQDPLRRKSAADSNYPWSYARLLTLLHCVSSGRRQRRDNRYNARLRAPPRKHVGKASAVIMMDDKSSVSSSLLEHWLSPPSSLGPLFRLTLARRRGTHRNMDHLGTIHTQWLDTLQPAIK